MDADRKIALSRDERGVTLVWVAIMLVAFCAMLGLAIDVGYMYIARGQLQNAADAAALAGAAKLQEGALSQQDARDEAVRYASENTATKEAVQLSSDASNTLSPGNDVVVGNWSQARNPNFVAGAEPVNAVQVRARRTADGDPGGKSLGGRVDLFFANVIGWSNMGASASAIAVRPPQAGFYIMLGRNTCDQAAPITVSLAEHNMAWTSLLAPSTNAQDIKDNYICPTDRLKDVEVCGKDITGKNIEVYTTNGTVGDIFKAVELDFYDPDYDRANKTVVDNVVTGWTIVVPVSTLQDPSLQPNPTQVWGYAKIVLSRACGTGGGNACGKDRVTFTAPKDVGCSGNEIVISSISCVSCDDKDKMLGVRPGLVQ